MMGINPRDMQRMMKKLGMKQENIEAEEVIIKTKDNNIIIRNPDVVKVNMAGQESFQISGDISIEEKKQEINEEDINIIIEQTGKTREEAINALKETKGDIAEAIIKLKE